ncbi:hypothetical protein GQ44DRAFT_777442 [Phaeosphaeriaceae sp. PMI808]|nr:hypothetical protein GQ44DRAFT_777442 [Phaeosphaeriaceae sp. PMI808]
MSVGTPQHMIKGLIRVLHEAHAHTPSIHIRTQFEKRKRSSSVFNDESFRWPIERSLQNAIVLFVLALGNVCQFEAKTLPNPAASWDPVQSTSQSSISDHRQRNIDVLPGMAYFAYAMDILGSHHGDHTIAHAHATILAALYLSQFARVLESWGWINRACQITLFLLKDDYEKLQREWYLEHRNELPTEERYRLNQIMLIYWTCLQLESDILAEMSYLIPSGITTHQNVIMYPEGEEDDTLMMLMIYSSQIWLRVILNEAHIALYGPKEHRGVNMEGAANSLESWRQMLPQQLAWKDEEPPATDLNIARLRAKYYGGLYMMLRPYLRIACHNIALSTSNGFSHRGSPLTDFGDAHRSLQETGSAQELKAMGQCIESAIQSTVAFDRVGATLDSEYRDYQSTRTKRLVVTNIVGILHAQFGNMLVLTSVYLSELHLILPEAANITKETLTTLIKRTINILQEVAPNSPTLSMD